jgi:hypothetical protein
MNPREMFANLKAIFPTLLIAVIVLAGAAAAIWYLPSRTAAVILGVVAALAVVCASSAPKGMAAMAASAIAPTIGSEGRWSGICAWIAIRPR